MPIADISPPPARVTRRSLRSQLVAALVLVLLIPAAILVLWGRWYADRVRMEAEHGLYDATRAVQRGVDEYLEQHRRALLTLGDGVRLEDRLDAVALETRLIQLRLRQPGFLGVGVIDASGTLVVCSPAIDTTGRPLAGRSLADREYFRHPFTTGRDTITGAMEGRGYQGSTIAVIAVPLVDRRGARVGVLAGSIILSRFARFEQEQIIPGARIVIADASDRVVFGGRDRRYQPLSSLDGTALAAVAGATDQPVFEFRDDGPGDRSRNDLLVGRAVSSVSGWQVFVTQPSEAVFHGVHVFVGGLLAALSGSLLLTAGLIWWLTARAMRPLEQVAEAIRGFSPVSAPPALPLRPDAPAEVAALVDGFAVMSERIGSVLSGVLPICAGCKKVRDQRGRWEAVESYVRDRSRAEFSHTICPDCAGELYPEPRTGTG